MNTSFPGNEGLLDVANRLRLLLSLPGTLGAGQSTQSAISRLVSLPEPVSVAKKRVSFSIFHQSIEDSDERGIMISWFAEEVGKLSLKHGVNVAGPEGRVSAI
jgi:hypothetical protein